ncbi:MAG: ABC transporter substrate-binding protein [Clostridia bacterium]|nr:ABC transporter substrate-binding protein [Clostridia bacterium]
MKRYTAALIVFVMLLSVFAGCTTKDIVSSDKVIKIGVFEPTTGYSASGGKKEVLGIKYANHVSPTVDIMGETYKIELEYADNKSDPDAALEAADELIASDISLAIGSYGSNVSIAASDRFQSAGIPIIGASCTNIYVTMGNDHYYRICYEDPFQATTLASFASDKFGAKKAYLLGEAGNEYDQGLIVYFEQEFIARGGQVIKDSFPEHNSDFTTYLEKAREFGADVIFIPVSIAYATQIIYQTSNLGLDIPILGSDTLDDNKVLEAVKGTDTQLYVSSHYQEGGNEDFDKSFKKYLNKDLELLEMNGGNDTISAVTVLGYDAYNVAVEAIKKANSADPAAIRLALSNISHNGISGDIVFDSVDGDANRSTAYIIKADPEAAAWNLEKLQETK